MSAHELSATGRGPRVRNNGPVGSVERPSRGLAEWMGHKPGKHPMLPLYPPGDRRNAKAEPALVTRARAAGPLPFSMMAVAVPLPMDLPQSTAAPGPALWTL